RMSAWSTGSKRSRSPRRGSMSSACWRICRSIAARTSTAPPRSPSSATWRDRGRRGGAACRLASSDAPVAEYQKDDQHDQQQAANPEPAAVAIPGVAPTASAEEQEDQDNQ